MAKTNNRVIPRLSGLLAVIATRYFIETVAVLEKPTFGMRYAYASHDYALERVIVTSKQVFKIDSTREEEKTIAIESLVLFRNFASPETTVRIEVHVKIHMEGDDIVYYDDVVVKSTPDLAFQAKGFFQPVAQAIDDVCFIKE